jgi:hypothetical protein
VIERVGFRIVKNEVVKGECSHCHTKIDGIWG